MNTKQTEDTLGIGFCRRQDIVIERGEGSHVWDERGRRYLDFTSGWGVTCLGHCHPVIVETLKAQAARLLQNPNSGFTYSPARARLLQTLVPVLPDGLARAWFVNSGAEANDAALKLARKITGRPAVVATRGGFHGRTQGALSVSVSAESAAAWPPASPHNRFVPHGDLDAMAAVLDTQVAAVIVEPIQGEGGVRIPADDYLAGVETLCRRAGALLIVDEIQTGTLFALQQAAPSVRPDIMTMGKGIAGGFPFAGFAVSEAVAAALRPGDHGGTYAGNPLGCAVADAVVSHLLAADIAVRVRDSGALLGARLQQLAQTHGNFIQAVRGRGLLWALQFASEDAVTAVTRASLERGLLVTPTRGGVVRLLPSLLVSGEEIDAAIAALDEALAASVPAPEITLDCSA